MQSLKSSLKLKADEAEHRCRARHTLRSHDLPPRLTLSSLDLAVAPECGSLKFTRHS
jgi:hypothetical protein